MASPISLFVPQRDPSDYDENYLRKLKDHKDSLVKEINPKEMFRFEPLLRTFSQYYESGMIMLLYKKMAPSHPEHLARMKEVNRIYAIEFNEEMDKLRNSLSYNQLLICNNLCLTMLNGY